MHRFESWLKSMLLYLEFGCAFWLGSGCSGRGVEWGWQEGVSEVGPVILSSAGLDAKLQKRRGPFAVHWKRALVVYIYIIYLYSIYPLCILTISLVYPFRLLWHFGFRTRMLSLLVARWPGSRSASLCFVAWLEFFAPHGTWQKRPGRQTRRAGVLL